jgi:hypothetical protein
MPLMQLMRTWLLVAGLKVRRTHSNPAQLGGSPCGGSHELRDMRRNIQLPIPLRVFGLFDSRFLANLLNIYRPITWAILLRRWLLLGVLDTTFKK